MGCSELVRRPSYVLKHQLARGSTFRRIDNRWCHCGANVDFNLHLYYCVGFFNIELHCYRNCVGYLVHQSRRTHNSAHGRIFRKGDHTDNTLHLPANTRCKSRDRRFTGLFPRWGIREFRLRSSNPRRLPSSGSILCLPLSRPRILPARRPFNSSNHGPMQGS